MVKEEESMALPIAVPMAILMAIPVAWNGNGSTSS
jgi:hypothetical protein